MSPARGEKKESRPREEPGKPYRAGFVAIAGRPNVGKSTLLNYLVGSKVSIISPRSQTTRRRVLAVKNLPGAQVVFVDTPGVFEPGKKAPATLLARRMLYQAEEALRDTDLALFLVDATVPAPTQEDRFLARKLHQIRGDRGVILILNKVDLMKEKRMLLPTIEIYCALAPFLAVFPVSALRGENLEKLIPTIVGLLPLSPPLFPLEDESRWSSRERVGALVSEEAVPEELKLQMSDLIREQALLFLRQEIPHALAVAIEEIRPGARTAGRSAQADPTSTDSFPEAAAPEPSHEILYVRATIFVEKDSQKGIIVGRGGKMLKQIGERARKEMARLLGQTIYLDLWVKVKEDWREKEDLLRWLGY